MHKSDTTNSQFKEERPESTLTEMQMAMRLAESESIEEARMYLRMLFPKMTETEIQKTVEALISIQ